MNSQIHILIVDDSSADAELITRELRKSKLAHELRWVKSKAEFIQALQDGQPDIVLCDYKMPGFDAVEALRILKEINPDIPLIIVSGTIGEELAIEIMKQGAVDYVMKDRLNRLVPAVSRAWDEKKLALERKQTEEELRRSEEKFAKIFRLSPDSVVVSSLENGVFLEVNQSFANQTGYSEAELVGHSSLPGDLGIWVNAADRQDFIKQLKEAGEVFGLEVVLRRKDGSIFNGLLSSKIIEIKGQLRTLTLIRDITERQRFLEALNRSQERYKLVFENMLNGFALHEMVLDEHGYPLDYIFLEVNPAFEKIIGREKEQLIGRKITEVFPGIQQEQTDWIGKYGALAAGAGDLKFESYSAALKKWFSINAFSPKSGQFVTIVEDITERKEIEKQLLNSQQLMEGIMNSITVRVFWKDKDLIYLGCNMVFAHDAGLSHPQEIIGKDDYAMPWQKQAELYRRDDQEVINTGLSKLLIEEPQTRPNGETIILLTNKIPLRDAAGEIVGVLGTYFDISERKKADAEKIKRAKELEVFYQASIGREERIIELKKEIEELKKQLDKP